MKTFSEKIREERRRRGMTQAEFGNLLGITGRMVAAYETDGRRPHLKKMQEIADTLGLPAEYLTDDSVADIISVFNTDRTPPLPSPAPAAQPAKPRIPQDEAAVKAMREVEFLKSRSQALFAGGELPQESKDAFFQAIYDAYLACRSQAEDKGADPDAFPY